MTHDDMNGQMQCGEFVGSMWWHRARAVIGGDRSSTYPYGLDSNFKFL
jgi:hypothetical protein